MAGSVSNHLFSQALCLDTTTLVFSYFSAQELCLLSRVCKFWKGIANQDSLWKALLQKEFKRSEIALNKNIPIKEVFQRSLEVRKELTTKNLKQRALNLMTNHQQGYEEEMKMRKTVQNHFLDDFLYSCPKDDFELLI
ncbi:MAG TPA: F-box protein [Rhabdochlamydiaceae bacterium]|nr:F-box protein [Rhabdochlamydiaceae bacterium]